MENTTNFAALEGLVMKIFAGLKRWNTGLALALCSLLGSLSAATDAEAQFRYGRYGGGFGLSIGIGGPVGGFGVGPRGFGYGRPGFGYGGYGYSGFGGYGYGRGIAVPVYPVPAYRVPLYRVPVYRAPVQTFSLQIEPRRRYIAPQQDYVYPGPDPDYVRPDSLYDYQSAKPPLAQQSSPADFGGYGTTVQERLVASATTLRDSLAKRPDDADVWLDYLDPDTIIASANDSDGLPLIGKILQNYDGVSGNAALSHIWTEPGFRRTHQALRDYIDSMNGRAAPALDSDPESLQESGESPNTDLESESRKNSDAIPSHEESDHVQELPTPI